MIPEMFTAAPLLRGILMGLFGVAFWAGGLVIAHYIWKRYRGDGQE